MAPESSKISVVAYTQHHRIEGDITLLKGEQLSDKLNINERKFEAITDVKVYAIADGSLVHEAPYLAVNKEQIAVMLPAT
jgi:hypothetical protein